MLYLPSYAGALRCIGQDLQERGIEIFELKTHANEFRLRCGDPNPPYTALIEIVFSKDTLQIIERQGRARRGQSTGEIRFDSMPEILRGVGEYIDKKGSNLRSLDNSASADDAAFELEFQNRLGEVERESLTMSFIHAACVRMYQRRTRSDQMNLLTRKR
jgi:hypothetical protein